MLVFVTILAKIIPLYLLIIVGFIAGRYLRVQKESIAPILIYVAAPVIVFNAALTAPITFGTMLLPILFYIIACFLCLTFYFIGKFFWKDTTRNILAFTAGD